MHNAVREALRTAVCKAGRKARRKALRKAGRRILRQALRTAEGNTVYCLDQYWLEQYVGVFVISMFV